MIVHVTDGVFFDPGKCVAMLINAGVTHPQHSWLKRLRDGGRLVLPITVSVNPNIGHGVTLRITRRGDAYSVKVVSFTAIYSAASGRDEGLDQQLRTALGTGALMKVRSARIVPHEVDESCAVHGDDICLSTRAIDVASADGNRS